MKLHIGILVLFLNTVAAEDALPIHELKFPDLGPTLVELSTGEKSTPTLLYQLPDNFDPDREFPVIVFLAGGTGAGQRSGGLGRARAIVGRNHFITVSLPLYRNTAALDPEATFDDLLIGVDDYPPIANAYAKMFAKFFETVPQARKTGNVMGGFSNGAHTTSVLLSCQDGPTLKHFSHFIFADGGVWLSGLLRQSIRDRRFLGLYGDTDTYWTRPVIIQQFQTMKATADAQKIDFELITMEGVGHKFPAEYNERVRKWIFGGFPDLE
ncbi:MAG: hypothetical protein P1U87_13395 [Verrucomicrobiales bacterium]|nr:hypothetical protein [Verrucomicrobiales bacterium]